jgi:hypothetical protein
VVTVDPSHLKQKDRTSPWSKLLTSSPSLYSTLELLLLV